VVDDWDDWNKWISSRGGIGVPATKAWESWWEEEQEHLQSTGLVGRIWEIILSFRFFMFQYGIMYHLNISNGNKSISVSRPPYLSYYTTLVELNEFHEILST
jgi:callose synthase